MYLVPQRAAAASSFSPAAAAHSRRLTVLVCHVSAVRSHDDLRSDPGFVRKGSAMRVDEAMPTRLHHAVMRFAGSYSLSQIATSKMFISSTV